VCYGDLGRRRRRRVQFRKVLRLQKSTRGAARGAAQAGGMVNFYQKRGVLAKFRDFDAQLYKLHDWLSNSRF
jgi:hypothetical protein